MLLKNNWHTYQKISKVLKKIFSRHLNYKFNFSSNAGKKLTSVIKRLGWKLHRSRVYQPKFSDQQLLLTYIGSFLGIAVLAYISVNTHYPLIAAPFGATAVLVFALPDSPIAQPRNLIGGNCLGALVSIVLGHLFGSDPWVIALAVSTAIFLMQLTKTLHPPGGAVALVGIMSHADWNFLFTPVLAGSLVLLIFTFAFHNLTPGRHYPKHWL